MDAVNFFLNSSCLNLLRYGICYLSETLLFVHLVAFQTDTVLFCGLICRVEDMNSKFQVVWNRILSFSECMVLKLDIHLASLDFKINIFLLLKVSFTGIELWNFGTITLHVDMGFLIWCQILHASCYGEILHTLNKTFYFTGTEIFFLWKFLLMGMFCCDLLAEERLMKELEAAREARRAVEKQREELVKKAKLMQTKTQNRRNHGKFDRSHFWLELFLWVLLLCNPCVNLPKSWFKRGSWETLNPKVCIEVFDFFPPHILWMSALSSIKWYFDPVSCNMSGISDTFQLLHFQLMF